MDPCGKIPKFVCVRCHWINDFPKDEQLIETKNAFGNGHIFLRVSCHYCGCWVQDVVIDESKAV